jgi:putative transposase
MVFYSRRDRLVHLQLLKENCARTRLRVLAYCLMPNHIHLVAVPEEEDSLAVALRQTHGRYAQYFNARKARCGHLWQNRFYSCPLGPTHLWRAIRYVEMNPVRAGIETRAWEYEWSSAEAHVTGRDGRYLLDMQYWRESGGEEPWRQLLLEPAVEEEERRLKRATYAGNPFGTKEFADQVAEIIKLRKEEREVEAKGCTFPDRVPGGVAGEEILTAVR